MIRVRVTIQASDFLAETDDILQLSRIMIHDKATWDHLNIGYLLDRDLHTVIDQFAEGKRGKPGDPVWGTNEEAISVLGS